MLRLDPARPHPGIEQRQHPAGRVTVQSRSTRSSAARTREDDVANTSAEVDQFMARLEHPLKEGVQRLRTAILASNDTITEHIKWNAPSFRHAGQDRVTFRLQPDDKLQLIFHRGAKVRTDTAAFAFNDPQA
jgi:hypothetical protein